MWKFRSIFSYSFTLILSYILFLSVSFVLSSLSPIFFSLPSLFPLSLSPPPLFLLLSSILFLWVQSWGDSHHFPPKDRLIHPIHKPVMRVLCCLRACPLLPSFLCRNQARHFAIACACPGWHAHVSLHGWLIQTSCPGKKYILVIRNKFWRN